MISPSLVLESRLGWSSQPWNPATVTDASKELAAQSGWVFDEKRFPSINLESPWNSGPGFGTGFEKDKQWHVSENLSWLQGKHTVKFGFQLMRQPRGDLPAGSLSYTFGDPQTGDPNVAATGYSLASFLLGIPSVQRTASQDYWFNSGSWSLYTQDEWKVSKRLTLNWGLRYDHFEAPSASSVRGVDVNGRGGLWAGADPDTGDWLIGATELFPSCNVANAAPCIPGDGLQDVPFGEHIRLADRPDIWDAKAHNFGPRFGLAYRVTDTTVFRAGYGVVYDLFSGTSQQWEGTVSQWPDNLDAQSTLNDKLGAPIRFIQDVQRALLSPLPSASPWDTLNWFSDPEKRNPLSHQWNMEIQHQMTDKLMVSVGYVGSTSYFLDHTALWNTAPTAGVGDPQLRRPYPYASTNWMGTDEGRSSYHAFTSQVNRKFANGFSLLGAYTWGKCIDNVSGWFGAENGPGGTSGLSNFYDTRPDKGLCSYDIPQFLTVNSSWELPFGRGKRHLNKGPASWILGNWQVNYILQARSGQPFSLEVPGDPANIGSGISWFNYSRPNLVGDPKLANPTPARWFNPAAGHGAGLRRGHAVPFTGVDAGSREAEYCGGDGAS